MVKVKPHDQFTAESYELRFTGSPLALAKIKGQKTGRPSKRLTFYNHGLKIIKAEVARSDKKGRQVLPIDRINHIKSFNQVRLHSPQMLYPGHYEVLLEFNVTAAKKYPNLNEAPDTVKVKVLNEPKEAHD